MLVPPAATNPAPTANGTAAQIRDGAWVNSLPRATMLSAKSTATTVRTAADRNDTSRREMLAGRLRKSISRNEARSTAPSTIRPSGRKLPLSKYSGMVTQL